MADDFVAMLVIVVAYTERISLAALACALALFAVLPLLRFAGSWRGLSVGFGRQ